MLRYGGLGWWVLGLFVALSIAEILNWRFPTAMDTIPLRWLRYLVIIAFMWFGPSAVQRRAVARSLAAQRCPTCAHDIRATPVDSMTGRLRCSECGASWDAPRAPSP